MIIFGDVWICSGQSNMDFEITRVANVNDELNKVQLLQIKRRNPEKESKLQVKTYINLRMFKVGYRSAPEPMHGVIDPDADPLAWNVWFNSSR